MSRRRGTKDGAKRRFWSAEDLQKLRELYPSQPTKLIAAQLSRTVTSVLGTANRLGLKKTAEFLRLHCRLQRGHTNGRATQFQKGIVPANKGLRRPGYSPGRMRETQSKKGCRTGIAAKNWVPVGTILPDTDGYLRIKVREPLPGEPYGYGNSRAWPQLHRHIWEQAKGPIPAGHIVIFKDRNKQNCALENLEMIAFAENLRRNSMWARLPRELCEVIQLKGALKRKLRRLHGEEQNQRSV